VQTYLPPTRQVFGPQPNPYLLQPPTTAVTIHIEKRKIMKLIAVELKHKL